VASGAKAPWRPYPFGVLAQRTRQGSWSGAQWQKVRSFPEKFMTPEKNPYHFRTEMHHRLEQRLKLSFQLIQNLDILLLPTIELEARINQELEQNPTLEISDGSESARSGESESGDAESGPARLAPVPEPPSADGSSPDTVTEILDRERDYTFRKNYRGMGDITDAKIEAMQNTPDRPESLQDYLYFQFLLMDLSESTRMLGKNIIYNIGDDGFLKTPLADIAGTNGVALEAAEKVLGIIRKLDPPGVGSRNPTECLLMQLSEHDGNFELKKLLISQYLERLQPNKLSDIAKELNIPLDELEQAMDEIKALNPHPAAGFSSEDIPYIVPDVIIAKIEDNYEIKIQSEYFPSLVISHYYRQIIADKNADKQTKDFIRDKINAANGLLQSIQLRKITLRQVAAQILLAQRDFFDNGLEHLRPMMMRDMAKKLGVHLSTVSRVVANKYVQTPHGVFSMKFFFSSTAEGSEGGACAQPVILAATRQIIENEDKAHPLSDIKIAALLKAKNFTVSRRTVALYREMLEIPNHSQRRKSES